MQDDDSDNTHRTLVDAKIARDQSVVARAAPEG
jgi:hypothetical protein